MALQFHESDSLGDIRQTGEAIVKSLRQAAEAAKRKETLAEREAEGLAHELERAHALIEEAEERVAAAEARAAQAEEWLTRVVKELESRVIEPLRRRTQEANSERF
jgi:hypothetical protein